MLTYSRDNQIICIYYIIITYKAELIGYGFGVKPFFYLKNLFLT